MFRPLSNFCRAFNMNVPESDQLVRFINTKNYAFNTQKPMNMLVEFVVDPKVVVVLGKDWVAIFPKDSYLESPINKDLLNQMVTFERVMQRPVNKEEGRYKLNFSLCGSKNLVFGQEYKFVYCNDFEILGVSKIFKIFDLNREVESLQNVVSNWRLSNHENSMVKQNQNVGNNQKSGEDVSLQENNREALSQTVVTETIPYNVGYDNRSQQNYQGFNQVHPNVLQQPVLSPRCFSAINLCNNCSRVGNLLSSQSDLYMQVKNLAEEKLVLIQRVSCLEKQIELGQAAYQKQSVLLMQEREMRINFQREVEIMKNYQEEYLSEPPATPQVAGFKKLAEGSPKSTVRLKAFIGHQEKKIQSLTERLVIEEQQVQFLTQKLAELQAGNICKVKIVEKEVDATLKKGWAEIYNNNEGEETSDID